MVARSEWRLLKARKAPLTFESVFADHLERTPERDHLPDRFWSEAGQLPCIKATKAPTHNINRTVFGVKIIEYVNESVKNLVGRADIAAEAPTDGVMAE